MTIVFYVIDHPDLLPISNKETSLPRRPSVRFRTLAPDKQEQHLLQVYYQPINQKDIFYPGNVPRKLSENKQILLATSCPDLIQSYVYEESATSISSSSSESDDEDEDFIVIDIVDYFFIVKVYHFFIHYVVC